MKFTSKQKRKIAVARDVIAQIKAKLFIPVESLYVDAPYINGGTKGDLRSIIRKANKPCEVCALGSAFMSLVRLEDKFELKPGVNIGAYGELNPMALRGKLREIFSSKELDHLEASFENEAGFLNDNGSLVLFRQLHGYRDYLEALDSDDRLIFLMQVIIDNGAFSLKLASQAAWAKVNPADYGF